MLFLIGCPRLSILLSQSLYRTIQINIASILLKQKSLNHSKSDNGLLKFSISFSGKFRLEILLVGSSLTSGKGIRTVDREILQNMRETGMSQSKEVCAGNLAHVLRRNHISFPAFVLEIPVKLITLDFPAFSSLIFINILKSNFFSVFVATVCVLRFLFKKIL